MELTLTVISSHNTIAPEVGDISDFYCLSSHCLYHGEKTLGFGDPA